MVSTILAQAAPATETGAGTTSSSAIDYNAVIETVTKIGTDYGLKILAALAIFIVGKIVARILVNIVSGVMQKRNIEPAAISFVTSLVSISCTVFIVIAVLSQLGVKTTSMVAVIGAAGLAIGLALQGSLSNFAAGFLILIFKPFKAGDFIEANGVAGKVKHIYIFTTELHTGDNKVVIIPNAKLTDNNIINYSASGQRRVDLTIGISYDSNIDEARKILLDIIANDERILKDPEPMVAVAELADSSINLTVRPWAKTDDYWKVYFATLETVKKRFDEAGIGIPFPQRDVHLYTANDNS